VANRLVIAASRDIVHELVPRRSRVPHRGAEATPAIPGPRLICHNGTSSLDRQCGLIR
jgi:hypothetical protein